MPKNRYDCPDCQVFSDYIEKLKQDNKHYRGALFKIITDMNEDEFGCERRVILTEEDASYRDPRVLYKIAFDALGVHKND